MGWTTKPPSGTPLKTGTWHTQNLIAFWSFQEGTGTTLNDIYGSNNGTLYNFASPPTSTSGWNSESWGYVLAFDGDNDYVDLGNTTYLSSSSPFTISLWAYLSAYIVGYPEPITLRTNTTYPYEIAFSNQANYLGITFGSADWYRGKNNVAPETYVGKWTHIVLTYNGNGKDSSSNFALYTNGVINSFNTAGNYGAQSQKSILGGITGAAYNKFNGRIDDVRIYSRALNSSEIAELYSDRWGIFQDPPISFKSVAGVPTEDIKSVAGVGINDIKNIG